MDDSHKPKHSNEDTSRAAFSQKIDELRKAVSLLYINKNMSGRNKFMEKWKTVGDLIFGAELIEIDTLGLGSRSYQVRDALEQQAEERRLALKLDLSDIEEKSVKSGSLVFEYVVNIIEKYGPEVSRLIYAENIIERVKPGLLAKAEEEKKKKEQEATLAHQQEEEAIRKRAQSLGATVRSRLASQEVKPVSSIVISDDVRPIDAGPPSAAEVRSEPPLSESTPIAEPLPSQNTPQSVSIVLDPVPPPPVDLSKPEKGFCKAQFNRVAVQLVA